MDTNFAISAIRSIKCYNPTYILADKAYDTELIKKTIVEETTALPQIPVKTRQKKWNIQVKIQNNIQTTSIQIQKLKWKE